MIRGFVVGSVAACVALAASNGLPPRSSPADYPAHAEAAGATVAAHVLDDEEVRSGFASDLYRRYAVVEVAMYPAKGSALEITDLDFSLQFAEKASITRPASPRTVAGALQRSAANRKDPVSLYPNVGVGVGNGGGMGTVTGTSVGVGIGMGDRRPGAASTPADRDVMQVELEEKALPSGKFDKPVSGYLYFPLPARKRVIAQQLVFERDGSKVVVPLKPATK